MGCFSSPFKKGSVVPSCRPSSHKNSSVGTSQQRHTSIFSAHDDITTHKRSFRRSSAVTQRSLSKNRYASRRDAKQKGDHGRNRCKRRRNARMGHSFIDLLIIAAVVLNVVVFLTLLNWISKQGD